VIIGSGATVTDNSSSDNTCGNADADTAACTCARTLDCD
jgi:hypothetical protein